MTAPNGQGISRGRFIAGTAGAVGVVAAGGLVGTELLSGQNNASSLADATPLALALALERLQAAFYAEAVSAGALDGELLAFATTARDHEAQHVSLIAPLVTDAPEEPEYDFGGDTTDPEAFGESAARLEDLAVSAYNGLIPGLSDRGLAVTSRIVSVDARHAAWVRAILGRDPAAAATDKALDADEVVKRIEATGYLREATP